MSRSTRVLVTDDDEALRGEIVEYLERKGLMVEEAADGAEAVSRMAALRPDVLVMDVHMPELDGLSVFQQIKEGEALLERYEEPQKQPGQITVGIGWYQWGDHEIETEGE